MGKKRIFFLLSGAIIFLSLPRETFGQLIVNEVYYQGDSTKEWVEIYNCSGEVFSLANCQFEDNKSVDGFGDLSINGREFLVVADSRNEDLKKIVSDLKNIIWIDGPIGNGLADGGDHLILSCGGEEMDKISWGSDKTYADIELVPNSYSLERI
ncbi:MAG TPA: lamin tail domain-containing protein, partial [Candidatus Woesebacteria bacterium]|nr:lamin tail domain-containing protein [Candidatus Woesebacteria bacterium]